MFFKSNPKCCHQRFYFRSDDFQNSTKSHQIYLTISVRKFVTQNFQRSPKLVTLFVSKRINNEQCFFRAPNLQPIIHFKSRSLNSKFKKRLDAPLIDSIPISRRATSFLIFNATASSTGFVVADLIRSTLWPSCHATSQNRNANSARMSAVQEQLFSETWFGCRQLLKIQTFVALKIAWFQSFRLNCLTNCLLMGFEACH